jgi:hypothetical protein
MPTPEQCKVYAAEYERLGLEGENSIRRAAALMVISQSWSTLANQLDWLSVIVEVEGNYKPRQGRKCCG